MKRCLRHSLILVLTGVFTASVGFAADSRKTERLVVVTLDGMRWQEIFRGYDPKVLSNKKFALEPKYIREAYSTDSRGAAREKLFPFLWGVVAKE
jgi:hypothetical protein